MGTLSIKIKHGYIDEADREHLVRYVHTKNGKMIRFHGGRGVSKDIDKALDSMMKVQKKYKKIEGRRLYHLMVGFPKSIDDVFLIKKIAEELSNYFFEEYQLLYGIHEDTEKLHIHFVINSVSYSERKKWHQSKGELAQMKMEILDIVNYVLKKNGYSPLSIRLKRTRGKKCDE